MKRNKLSKVLSLILAVVMSFSVLTVNAEPIVEEIVFEELGIETEEIAEDRITEKAAGEATEEAVIEPYDDSELENLALKITYEGNPKESNSPTFTNGSLTASHNTSWNRIAAVNDGWIPPETQDYRSEISDQTNAWGTWGQGTSNNDRWIQYDFGADYKIAATGVWWFDNSRGGDSGVLLPASWKFQYMDTEGVWQDVTLLQGESYGLEFDVYNTVNFEPITARQVRLSIVREGDGNTGVGIIEWQVWNQNIEKAEPEIESVQITGGRSTILLGATETFNASVKPTNLNDVSYNWSVSSDGHIAIAGSSSNESVNITALSEGNSILTVTATHNGVVKTATLNIKVQEAGAARDYLTFTAEGKAPILPATVVVEGIQFDDPTTGSTLFDEEFNEKLMPVEWDAVDPSLYAKGTAGNTFTVNGVISGGKNAKAVITVKPALDAPEANSAVTFENIKLTDIFWAPKQKVNSINSLNKAIEEIGKAAGGEPNFDNAIKKLNGEAYDAFRGYVFQDTDIYKSLEAISYTLSALHDDTDSEIVEQRAKLEETLERWIPKIEQVQYADGYINTHFTLRSTSYSGGSGRGTHRWRYFANHEMYNAGHFFEAVVAYTRYREGIGSPDMRLYVVGKRFADHIVDKFGPDKSLEVPGHEEVELALIKMAKMIEEYEGEGTGDKYIDTAKALIDRRGHTAGRPSGYRGGEYSQDHVPFVEQDNVAGHSVRAGYLYTAAADVAAILPESDSDRTAYLGALDTIWDKVNERNTYITGGVGVATTSEGFGYDYELPNNNSYCEICAGISMAMWNLRMNQVHEDAKYADVMEKALYNAVLVGTNLNGDRFYYSTLLEAGNGNPRSQWFDCACCPPNLMRTIASLSGYMYTVHGDNVFVNMYVGSEGNINVRGTNVLLEQITNYPWEGSVAIKVNPEIEKEFTMNIRIPGWVQEQVNKNVTIKVNGAAVTAPADKGYVAITRNWQSDDIIEIDMPMEVRLTDPNPNVVTNKGRLALERGPLVYAMETAGNGNETNGGTSFDARDIILAKNLEYKASEYKPELLRGVVEITGEARYGTTSVPHTIQAIPYYAWNNRGNDGVEGQNNGRTMVIWAKSVKGIYDGISISGPTTALASINEEITLSASVDSTESNVQYEWVIDDGESFEIVGDANTSKLRLRGIKKGQSTIELKATIGEGETAEVKYAYYDIKAGTIAMLADVSTSYVSSWETLGALNDGDEPTSSSKEGKENRMAYGNWNNSAASHWIQYDFDRVYTVNSTDVYWWNDGGGINWPASWYCQYWDAETETWKDVESLDGQEMNYPVNHNQYSTAAFKPVATTKLRVTIVRQSGSWTGALQWRVNGEPYEENEGLPYPVSAEENLKIRYDFAPENLQGTTLNEVTNTPSLAAEVMNANNAGWFTANILGVEVPAVQLGSPDDLNNTSGAYLSLAPKIQDMASIDGEMTLAAWVNFRSLTASWVRIWEMGTGSNYTYWMASGANAGNIGYTAAVTNSGYGGERFAPSGTNLPRGEWVHIAVSYDTPNQTITLYLNGDQVAQREFTEGSFNLMQMSAGGGGGSTDQNYIARALDGTSFANMNMADFRVYDKILTAGEISQFLQVTSKDRVDRDYEALEITSPVESDLELITQGGAGSIISWESENAKYITNDGIVTRPTIEVGDVEVTLKASISFDGYTRVKTFVLTVKAYDFTAAELLELDAEVLEIDDIATTDFSLPTKGNLGSQISWASNKDNIIRIESDGETVKGIVTRPAPNEGAAEVILTATLSLDVDTLSQALVEELEVNGYNLIEAASIVTATKDFTVTVPPGYAWNVIVNVPELNIKTPIGFAPKLPNDVYVYYNDGTSAPERVVWVTKLLQ